MEAFNLLRAKVRANRDQPRLPRPGSVAHDRREEAIVNNETPSPLGPVPSLSADAARSCVYRVVAPENFDIVQPLWEKLRTHHAGLPWHFSGEIHGSTFEPRKQELLAKAASGKLLIEMVSAAPDMTDVAYCISTVSDDGNGEVDSLFVDERFRGRGIGSELLRRALAWLESAGAKSKLVTVAHGNEAAISLYKRFGFYSRSIVLQQSRSAGKP